MIRLLINFINTSMHVVSNHGYLVNKQINCLYKYGIIEIHVRYDKHRMGRLLYTVLVGMAFNCWWSV